MEQVVLDAKRRAPGGKGAARKARGAGLVPAVAYGHGLEPVPLAVDGRTLSTVVRHHHGSGVLLDLRVDGQAPEGLAAIIKSLQTDPVSEEVLSVDFQWVSLTEQIHVEVALHTVGTAVGVTVGGILEQMLHEVTVSSTPLQIPSEIVVDVRGLQIGDTLHVSDLVVPEGVQVLAHGEEPMVTVRAPHVVTVVEAAPEEGAEEEAEAEEGEEEE